MKIPPAAFGVGGGRHNGHDGGSCAELPPSPAFPWGSKVAAGATALVLPAARRGHQPLPHTAEAAAIAIMETAVVGCCHRPLSCEEAFCRRGGAGGGSGGLLLPLLACLRGGERW